MGIYVPLENPWLCALALFAGTFVLMQLSVIAAQQAGLLDHPHGRKQHAGVVPLAGGPAIFIAFMLGGGIAIDMHSRDSHVLVAFTAIFLLGLVDDWRGLNARTRLAIQALPALLVAQLGLALITDVGDLLSFGPIELGILAIPLTVLAFAGLTNALNMVDGIDGLAGTLALVPLAAITVLAAETNHPLATTTLTLLVPLVVFLLFNLSGGTAWLPKAFLGDSGSTFLGFAICYMLIYSSQVAPTLITPVTALWLVTVPLMDMLTTMLLRLRAGRNPMSADRRHLHHQLVDRGLSVATTRRLLALYAAGAAVFGLLLMPLPEYFSLSLYCLLFIAHCGVVLGIHKPLADNHDPADDVAA